MRFSKVLFTTDFSEAAHHALPHAVEMCRRFEADLTVLHCRTLFADDPQNLEYQFLDSQRLEEFLEQSLRAVSSRVEDDVPCHSAIVRNSKIISDLSRHGTFRSWVSEMFCS